MTMTPKVPPIIDRALKRPCSSRDTHLGETYNSTAPKSILPKEELLYLISIGLMQGKMTPEKTPVRNLQSDNKISTHGREQKKIPTCLDFF